MSQGTIERSSSEENKKSVPIGLEKCPTIVDKARNITYFIMKYKDDSSFISQNIDSIRIELSDKFDKKPGLKFYGTSYFSGIPAVVWVKGYSSKYKVHTYLGRFNPECFSSVFYEQDIDLSRK